MKKGKNIILIIFIILCIVGLIYSVSNIIIWHFENKKTDVELKKIETLIILKEPEDSSNTKVIETDEKNAFDPYWDYIKENLIDVDFSSLKEINNEVLGWIEVKGTNVNYPFVQTKDNNYYLKHSFDKSYNRGGWIFLDYRNNFDEYDSNTIIYGHSLKAGSMFGSLNKTLKSSWLSNKNNHIIRMSSENKNTMWQIFSIYTIENTSDYLKTSFKTGKEYQEFIDLISSRSIYDFNALPNVNDKILTLSSCYKTSDYRLVIHAKLIKEQNRQNI